MMRRRLLFLLAFLLSLPHTLSAQIRASEQAAVKQVINGTTITIEFYRPVERGRDSLFGKVVHWGETWTPGANWATTIEADRDLKLNGLLVPKGKYSIWMVTARDSAWTFFLDKTPRLFHTRRPKGTDNDLVRFKVTPRQGPSMEALMWYFPTVQRDSSVLRMHWGTTIVDLRIHTMPATIPFTAEQQQMLSGDWMMRYDNPKGDSSALRIFAQGDRLIMRRTGEKDAEQYDDELLQIRPNEFRLGLREKGILVDTPDNQINFVFENGKAVSFELMNNANTKPFARGRRVK